MKAICFLLRTEQPLLATSLQGEPNSSVSHPYIPGSMIRGALIGRYLRQHKSLQNTDVLDDPEVRRLFFDGRTRYLNAYLATNERDQPRSLPVPRSWLRDKNDEPGSPEPIPVFDFSCGGRADGSYKSLGEYFCAIRGGYGKNVSLYSAKRRVNIHNRRDRKLGRGVPDRVNPQTGEILKTGEGAVFRYDALDVGQIFQAVVLCDEDNDAEQIQRLLEPTDFWLGGSQSAGYGYTKIIQDSIQISRDWIEVGIPPKYRPQRDTLSITLLSDLILRDEWGQYVVIPPSPPVSENFDKYIYAPLVPLLEAALHLRLKPKVSFAGNAIVGGFNRKWGLPLPQVQAFAAGSVFIFDIEQGELKPEHISHLEIQSLGERRVEGFGRIAVNWLPENRELNARKVEFALEQDISKSLSLESRDLASQIAARLLRQKLDTLLVEKVGDIRFEPSQIKNSQLSRLEIVARQGLVSDSRLPVLRLLRNLPSNARRQFEQTKIQGKPLNQQIYEWLRKPKSWLSNLEPVTIADITQDLSNQLAREYTLRLIMAVAKKEKINDER